MNLNTLSEFRQQVYACMESRADALFSLCDGLLSEAHARSLPELSLSPYLGRQWPSVYAALADGKIDIEQLRARCVRSVLADLPVDALIWIAVDSSSVERPEAATSEDRGYIHVSNLPLADKPVSIGWSFSVVALPPETASSWAPILEVQRIASTQTAIGVAIEQLRLLKPLVGARRVIVLADRWYGTPEMLRACRELGYSVLIRLKSNRNSTAPRCAPIGEERRLRMDRFCKEPVARPSRTLLLSGKEAIRQANRRGSVASMPCISSRIASWSFP